MRKFFQRLDNSSKSTAQSDYQRENLGHSGSNAGPSGTHSGGSFIGKVFSIGQYNCTVEDIIAEGGFALVFLVKAQGNLGRFALKRLFVNSEQDLENAKNEIEISKKLCSHKNIVNLVDSRINYCGNGVYEIFLLMDHCKGHLLQKMNEKLKDGSKFTEPEVIQIFCDLCEAVAKMHQLEPPVIHRDLKVENILFNESGTFQVCDFGSATSRILCASSPDQSALEIEEEIKRYTTLAYRAPEMIDVYCGKPITTKSDIWALGCCLFKLCFFQMPFGESTLAIQNAQLTIPDDKFDDYSGKLLSLIGYMLVPDPEARPDIFQVSQLAFKLAEQNCPIVNIKAKVVVPDWSEIRVPPSESQAREIRKSASGHNLQAMNNNTSSNNNNNNNNINTSNNNNNNVNNSSVSVTDSGLTIDSKTTSVTPRQRPKTSITLSNTLPTSPVAFAAGNTNRATTPCDLTSTVNTLTSVSASGQSVAPAQVQQLQQPTIVTVTIPPPPQSAAAAVAAAAAAAAAAASTSIAVPVPTSSSTTSASSSSSSKNNDPLKFTPPNDSTSGGLSSTNPFLEHSPNIPIQLSPAQSLRNLSIQHDSSTSAFVEPSTLHHQHRRNLSDTSAFSQKNIKTFECDSNRMNSYSLQSSVNISQPVSCPNSGTRSLNPFIDSATVASFEDQQFGHEFDRIRQENNFQTTGLLIDDNDGPTNPPKSESIMAFTNNYDPFEAKNAAYRTAGSLVSAGQPQTATVELQRPSVISSKPKQNTIIQITSGSAFIVQNQDGPTGSGHVIRPSPSSAFVAVVGTSTTVPPTSVPTGTVSEQITQQMKHLTLNAPTDKSISSSSQGQETNLTQAANYMPLYSSEESEKSSSDSDSDSDMSDDTAAPIAEAVHLGDDVLDNLIHESSNDLTKPLVDENDDDEYEEDDEDEDDDDDSSIGSASDLQHSSSESNNSSSNSEDYDSDDLNSSKSSQSRSSNSLSDQGKTEELNGFVIVPAQHHLHHHHHHQRQPVQPVPTRVEQIHHSKLTLGNIKTIPAVPLTVVAASMTAAAAATAKASPITNQLEIQSATNTDGDGTSCSEILSTTSSMNLSAKVAQDNSNVTIDQLIGHIDANRPLLEEDDDPEDDPESVRPMIEIDQEIEYIPPAQTLQQQAPQPPPSLPLAMTHPQLDSILSSEPAPIDMFSSMSSSTHSVILAQSIGQKDFDVISSTDSEENRRLDEEVEMSLTKQVLMDQMNRKDLFGSVPFTDKELVDKSIEQQNKIALQKTLSLERSAVLSSNDPIRSANNTDLFGAVPFNSTEKLPSLDHPPLKSIKLDPPPQAGSGSLMKHSQTFSGSISTVTIAATKPVSLGGITVSNISSKPIPSILASQAIPKTSTVAAHSSLPAANKSQEPKSPIPSLKSVGKIKTKTARKYEVDESDDEVDGLLEPQDEDGDIVVKKKTKKDAKKEKTDKKSKEKEDKKERKNREKLEKVKEKELKKKKKSSIDEKQPCEGQPLAEGDKIECKPSVDDKPERKSKSMLRADLKVLRVSRDKKSKANVNKVEIESHTDDLDLSDKRRASSASGLISSTPIKAELNDGTIDDPKMAVKLSKKKKDKKIKEKKEKKKGDKIKLGKKHQAFANMSFEDETTSVIISPTGTPASTDMPAAVSVVASSSSSAAAATTAIVTATLFNANRAANPVHPTSIASVGVAGEKMLQAKPNIATGEGMPNNTNANVTITRC